MYATKIHWFWTYRIFEYKVRVRIHFFCLWSLRYAEELIPQTLAIHISVIYVHSSDTGWSSSILYLICEGRFLQLLFSILLAKMFLFVAKIYIFSYASIRCDFLCSWPSFIFSRPLIGTRAHTYPSTFSRCWFSCLFVFASLCWRILECANYCVFEIELSL